MGTPPQMLREFGGRREDHGEPVQMLEPTGASFRIAILGAVSTLLGPFPANARFVSIHCNRNCFFRFGDASVVASTGVDSDPLTAGQREYYTIRTATHIAAVEDPADPGGRFHVRVLI